MRPPGARWSARTSSLGRSVSWAPPAPGLRGHPRVPGWQWCHHRRGVQAHGRPVLDQGWGTYAVTHTFPWSGCLVSLCVVASIYTETDNNRVLIHPCSSMDCATCKNTRRLQLVKPTIDHGTEEQWPGLMPLGSDGSGKLEVWRGRMAGERGATVGSRAEVLQVQT